MNIDSSKQAVDHGDNVLNWVLEHRADFDFEYIQMQMNFVEFGLYKQSVIENAIDFFQSLAH